MTQASVDDDDDDRISLTIKTHHITASITRIRCLKLHQITRHAVQLLLGTTTLTTRYLFTSKTKFSLLALTFTY